MAGISYHELSACSTGRRRHSSGEQKQFLLVCALAFAFLLNAFINAGLFTEVLISDCGIYPGGQFIFKLVEHKDYATTGGFWRMTRRHLVSTMKNEDDSIFDDILYAVYVDLDDTYSGVGRYFTGILIDESMASYKQTLLDRNNNSTFPKINEDETEKYDHVHYEVGDLPSVRSLVATFPWTDGFVSALLHNYKVFPALRKQAEKYFTNGEKFVVSTTCNREKQMCVHYVPMIQQGDFLLGYPDTHAYESHQDDLLQINPERLRKGFSSLFGL
mmetsp:Transcript_11756/g.21975  ORF Transcript_11756/g.21975 Transcript_11756/m.21975 type:complete len:273 (-) Transcript_11756:2412-3230(-)